MEKDENKGPFDFNSKDAIIFYVGKDEGYWRTLKKDLKTSYSQISLQDAIVFHPSQVELQKLVKPMTEASPKAIFFDLSRESQAILHIIRIINRANYLIKPALFGLLDITTDQRFLRLGMLSGLSSVHVKTSETEAVIHDFVARCFNDKLIDHPFATSKLNDVASAFIPAKLTCLSAQSMRIESDLSLELKENYFIHSYWSEQKKLPTPLVKVKTQSDENLFYEFTFSQEVDFIFSRNIDDFFPADQPVDPKQYNKKKKELDDEAANAQKTIQVWLNENQSISRPKHIKVMVIDKQLTFYDSKARSDGQQFVLRCFNFLTAPRRDLLRFKPHLLVFHMEDIDEETAANNEDIAHTFNEINTLSHLIGAIKTIPDYQPYIIVFNVAKISSDGLKEKLSYKNLIAYPQPLDPVVVVKMGEMLGTKIKAPSFGGKVLLDKDMIQSYVEIEISISILACSEIDIYFNCDKEFTPGTILRINFAESSFYVTTSLPPKKPKVNAQFYGIIHGLGEDKKMILRKFINSVFFRSHDEKKQAEIEEFKKLNDKIAQTRNAETAVEGEESQPIESEQKAVDHLKEIKDMEKKMT